MAYIEQITNVPDRTGDAEQDSEILLRTVATVLNIVLPGTLASERTTVTLSDSGIAVQGKNDSVYLPRSIVEHGSSLAEAIDAGIGAVLQGSAISVLRNYSSFKDEHLHGDNTGKIVKDVLGDVNQKILSMVGESLKYASMGRTITTANKLIEEERPASTPYITEALNFRGLNVKPALAIMPSYKESPEGITKTIEAMAKVASIAAIGGRSIEYALSTPALVRQYTDMLVAEMLTGNTQTNGLPSNNIANLYPIISNFIRDSIDNEEEQEKQEEQPQPSMGGGEPVSPPTASPSTVNGATANGVEAGESIESVINAVANSGSTEDVQPEDVNISLTETDMIDIWYGDTKNLYPKHKFRFPATVIRDTASSAHNEAYREISLKTRQASAIIGSAFDSLSPTNRRRVEECRRTGNLTSKRLVNVLTRPEDDRFFTKKNIPKPIKIGLLVVIDCSGSMIYDEKGQRNAVNNRLTQCKEMAIALANGVSKNPNVHLKIIGHNFPMSDGISRRNPSQNLYYVFDSKDKNPSPSGICSLTPKYHNMDALTLQNAESIALSSFDGYDYKFVVLFADGQPCIMDLNGSGGETPDKEIAKPTGRDKTWANIRETAQRMQRQKIQFFYFCGFGEMLQSTIDTVLPACTGFAVNTPMQVAEKIVQICKKIAHTR